LVDRHRLDQCVNAGSGSEFELVDSQAGERRRELAAAVERDLDKRQSSALGTNRGHAPGQHRANADIRRSRRCEGDVGRADHHPDRLALRCDVTADNDWPCRVLQSRDLEARIKFGDLATNKADDAESIGGCRAIDLRKRFRRRTHADDASSSHDDDVAGEAPDFFDCVRNIHDGDAILVAQPLDQADDFELALKIQRGERLVHQQNARRGE